MPRPSKRSKTSSPNNRTTSITPVPDPPDPHPSNTSPEVQWKSRSGFYYPVMPSEDDGKTLEVKEFEVSGIVEKCYLKSGAKVHTLVVGLSGSDINTIKRLVETAPELNGKDANYRWPFDGNIAKFASKHDLDVDFLDVWDGREISDTHDISKCQRLPSTHIVEGCKVLVEFTIVLYSAKPPKGDQAGFESGCSLKVLSIGLLEESPFDFDSPRKKKRVA